MRYEIEKYHGANSRHTCPACNARREFSLYIDEAGNRLAETVGKCNRTGKCGYHFTPKMYFGENPNFSKLEQIGTKKRKNIAEIGTISLVKSFDVIGVNHLQATLGDYEQNPFVQFLLNLFPEDVEAVWKAVKNYFVGTFEGKAIFWQIDQSRRIRTGKMMLYNAATGKRIAETFTNRNGETIEIKTNWIHARLKKQGKLKEDFSLKQCYFGEHLLKLQTEKPLAIVESERKR